MAGPPASKPAESNGAPLVTHTCHIKENTCCAVSLSAGESHGPVLRFKTVTPDGKTWEGSALYIVKSATTAPVLSVLDGGSTTRVKGVQLYSYESWSIWRFALSLPVLATQRKVEYWVQESKRLDFYIAGEQQQWHWGFYSCNGFTSDVPVADQEAKWGGVDVLWDDVLKRHQAQPFHAMVGGGDQLYCDDVWQLPTLKEWLDIPAATRPDTPITDAMKAEVEAYYFHHYTIHFTSGQVGNTWSHIPQVMTWDDHDIFDGWGSYPPELQSCSVFQGVFSFARRYYLLYQQHTNDMTMADSGLFGKKSYNQVVQFGSRVALVLPDQRGERLFNQVVSMSSYMDLFSRLNSLPDTIRHFVFVTTVPIVYTHLMGANEVLGVFSVLDKIGAVHALFQKTGIAGAVFSQFDEPELLDDLKDHWTAPAHADERRFMIEHLQMLAKSKEARVTLISGDVHLAATGRLYSNPKVKSLRNDFRYMPQIVSSAIANAPPPDGLVKVMHLLDHAGKANKETKGKMVKLFDGKKLINSRNWCEVHELTQTDAEYRAHLRQTNSAKVLSPGSADEVAASSSTAAAPQESGSLCFTLRVEQKNKAVQRLPPLEYATIVPVLERSSKPKKGHHLHHKKPATDAYGSAF